MPDTEFSLPPIRPVFGRDHWPEELKQKEAAFRRATNEVHARRKIALESRGWLLSLRRSYMEDGCGVRSHAVDPVTGQDMLEAEACVVQEEREPGSIEPWPERDFELPSSPAPFVIVSVTPQPLKIQDR